MQAYATIMRSIALSQGCVPPTAGPALSQGAPLKSADTVHRSKPMKSTTVQVPLVRTKPDDSRPVTVDRCRSSATGHESLTIYEKETTSIVNSDFRLHFSCSRESVWKRVNFKIQHLSFNFGAEVVIARPAGRSKVAEVRADRCSAVHRACYDHEKCPAMAGSRLRESVFDRTLCGCASSPEDDQICFENLKTPSLRYGKALATAGTPVAAPAHVTRSAEK